MSILKNKYFLFTARCILAFIFIYSGIEKISNPEGFSVSILNYKLLPASLVNIPGIVLPWIELIAGILLLFGISVKENAFIISVLLSVFIIAIIISVARGLNIDCGCFGTSGGSKVGIMKILENTGLLFLGIVLIYFNSTFLSLSKD